eukprot:c21663_g2_i1.p1 GENE.c21663_g2_i1~~c21663_g2_i1.p1  ORF type:complete len:609 (+),score=201.09 c21663_g2_i1:300-2126(+)
MSEVNSEASTIKKRGKKGKETTTESTSHNKEIPQPIEEPKSKEQKKEIQNVRPPIMSLIDWILVLILIVLATFSRFYQISVPQDIVWDESHFTKFLTWYFTGHYFVDIHPGLAKMIFALVLSFTSFEGANELKVQWWIKNGFIGTSDWKLLYRDEHGSPYTTLRCTSAVFGILLVGVTYPTIKAMGCGRVAAFLGAWFILWDNLILLQSRLILTDIFLYFFNMASYGCSFMCARTDLSFKEEIFWTFMTGFMLGCAVSVKYTAIGTMGLVGVHQAIAIFTLMWNSEKSKVQTIIQVSKKAIWKSFLMIFTISSIFFGLWILHIFILPYEGQGTGFMNEEFQMSLVPKLSVDGGTPDPDACPNHYNAWKDCGWPAITQKECESIGCCYDPTSTRKWCYPKGIVPRTQMSLVNKIKEVLRATWSNNQGETVMIHPHMSEWWEWPTMNCRQVPFGSVRPKGKIISIGNPAVWWTVIATFFISLLVGIIYSIYKFTISTKTIISSSFVVFVSLWIGYVCNVVPYMLIPRSKFVYHYIPALEVGCLLVAFSVNFLIHISRNSKFWLIIANLFAFSLIIAIFSAFYFWSPWTYGFQLEREEHNSRKWVTKWGVF